MDHVMGLARARELLTAELGDLDERTRDREIDDERLDARPEVPTCREHADTRVVL
jgi:hypothetical protein